MHEHYPDSMLRDILHTVKSFACVGVSCNSVRPSYFVGRYLSLRGYRVIPINPAYAGQSLFGETVLDSLESIPSGTNVDVVDIFRKPSDVPAIVDSALRKLPDLKVIWMQVGVWHGEAAKKARKRGVTVIQNRCPKIENQRLCGELRMAGFNTGIITSRRENLG